MTLKKIIAFSGDFDDVTLRSLYCYVDMFRIYIYFWYYVYKAQSKVKKNEKKAGRKSFKPELMFFLLILKEYYQLSDAKLIDKVKDSKRVSELLGIEDIPSPKTLWHYKKLFAKSNLFEEFFDFVKDQVCQETMQHICRVDMSAANFMFQHILIDSTFLNAIWRRDSVEINEKIKQNLDKHQIYPNPNVASHKDLEATFTKKRGKLYFGYKQHIACDAVTKLVLKVTLTTASTHDVKQLLPLVDKLEATPEAIYADSGYIGQKYQNQLTQMKIKSMICKRGTRNHKLDQADKEWNNNISKIRCRIEHVFSGHNNNKKFCSYSSKYAEMATFCQYTIYNIKRGISILNNKCNILNLNEHVLSDTYQKINF